MIGYHRHPPSLASTCAARGEAPGPHRVQVLGAQVKGVVLGSAWPQARSAASQKLCSTADRQQYSCSPSPPSLPHRPGLRIIWDKACALSKCCKVTTCSLMRQHLLAGPADLAGHSQPGRDFWLAVHPLPQQQEPTYCCWGGGGCRGPAAARQKEADPPQTERQLLPPAGSQEPKSLWGDAGGRPL